MPFPFSDAALPPPALPVLDGSLPNTILSASDDQASVRNPQGRFLRVCVTGAAMLGLPPGSPPQRDAPSLGLPDDLAALRERKQQRVLATGRNAQGAMHKDTAPGPREFSSAFALLSSRSLSLPRPAAGDVVRPCRSVPERNAARRQAAPLPADTPDISLRLENKGHEIACARSQRQEASDRLRALAARLGLACLLTHRALLKRQGEEHSRAAPHDLPPGLLLLDIVHFRCCTDPFSHPASDTLLHKFADTLHRAALQTDTPARCGGGEFCVVVPQIGPPGAPVIAKRIRTGAEQGMDAAQSVTVSIRACVRATDNNTPDAPIACANQAPYRAKDAGGNEIRQ